MVEIRLHHQAEGRLFVLEPGAIILTGSRTPFAATFLRSFLLVALAAISLLGVCLWLSGFVAYPIAVAGTLTVLLTSMIASPWVPGRPLIDPGARLSAGLALAWGDLLATGGKALASLVIAVALSFRADGRGRA